MTNRPGATLALLAMISLITTGCMRSIDVPRADLESAKTYHGNYRVQTNATRFLVHDFATTDSSLVITRLSGDDRQFGRMEMPVTIPMVNVEGVYEQKVDAPKTGLIVIGGLAVLFGTILALLTVGASDTY
jgi:hypothetical protein